MLSKRKKSPEVEKVEMFFAYNIDIDNKTLYFGDVEFEDGEEGVSAMTVEVLLKGLHVLDNIVDDKPITIIINNVGGDVYQGLAAYDAIKSCKNEVIIKVYGQCMSMATIIMQAANKRLIAPNARFMIHEGQAGLSANHPKITYKWADQFKKDDILCENIYLAKIREKKPNFTIEELRKLLMFDTIFTAQEAVAMGLCDEVLNVK